MIEVRYYLDRYSKCPYRQWRNGLDVAALGPIERSIGRLAAGNKSNVKSVGEGVHELKIDFGPGYRIYFGWQGSALVIFLGGGTKKRQDKDSAEAKEFWWDFKDRVR